MLAFARRFIWLVILAFASSPLFSGPVAADLRLIMVTSDHCPFCQLWERGVGVIYDKSPYASDLPLTRIEFGTAIPASIKITTPVIGTPTFIILGDDRELDRISGYEDAEMFWWWLSDYSNQ